MMKRKAILSTALAAAMMFAPLVGASTVKAEEIDGSAIFVDQKVYDVTLPTTTAQKFYIDPQGLIALGKSGTAGNEGTITGAYNMYAVNKSSVPVALSVSYKLVDSATTGGVDVATTVADSGAAVQKDSGKKIAVSVSAVESATDADSSGNDCGGKVFKATEAGVDVTGNTGNLSTADVVYADKTAVTANYLMTAETYKAQLKSGKTADDAYDASSYEYVIDSTAKKASCVKLTIGGYCSKVADWSAYANGTETLKMEIVFKFKEVGSDKGDYTDAKVATDEIVVGPRVSISTSGLITMSGLTADRNYKSIAISNGSGSGTISTDNSVWGGDWTRAEGGTATWQLKPERWQSWYTGKTITVTLTLTDDTQIVATQTMP